MIQLSNDEFIKLYKLASIGKLVGGLVHNLNGPMQNLGLDIEMAFLSLHDESKLDEKTAKGIVSRLRRMEEEHERINSLIRTTSAKTADYYDKDNNLLSIREFLNQELAYLHTNLYFKHNVQTEIITVGELPSMPRLTQDSVMALGWFLQDLVEELESQKIKGLTIKIMLENSSMKIAFSIHGGKLSEQFMTQLQDASSTSDIQKPWEMAMGIFIAMMIFKANGITLESYADSSSSTLSLNFPIATADSN
jgi:hypothetical protein